MALRCLGKYRLGLWLYPCFIPSHLGVQLRIKHLRLSGGQMLWRLLILRLLRLSDHWLLAVLLLLLCYKHSSLGVVPTVPLRIVVFPEVLPNVLNDHGDIDLVRVRILIPSQCLKWYHFTGAVKNIYDIEFKCVKSLFSICEPMTIYYIPLNGKPSPLRLEW